MVLSTYIKHPKAIPARACENTPKLYRNLTPIWVPNFAINGANKKAARFDMPNTKPY